MTIYIIQTNSVYNMKLNITVARVFLTILKCSMCLKKFHLKNGKETIESTKSKIKLNVVYNCLQMFPLMIFELTPADEVFVLAYYIRLS